MNLAVIPARGGSKRIPRKNIRDFCGKPIIAWSIEAAHASGCFDAVIVSTDDEEIAAIAREWGAETPFMRPSELADDFTETTPVMRHAIEWYAKNATAPELACCIYATAPFVSADDIRLGEKALRGTQYEYAFSVSRYPFPIQRAVRISLRGGVEMFNPEYFNTRSQDLEEAFHDAGQFYWGKSHSWVEGKPIFSIDSIPVILPQHRVQDIDTQEDWERAESMFLAQQVR
jgi:pseudaminic acid cytidylyltransferase